MPIYILTTTNNLYIRTRLKDFCLNSAFIKGNSLRYEFGGHKVAIKIRSTRKLLMLISIMDK